MNVLFLFLFFLSIYASQLLDDRKHTHLLEREKDRRCWIKASAFLVMATVREVDILYLALLARDRCT